MGRGRLNHSLAGDDRELSYARRDILSLERTGPQDEPGERRSPKEKGLAPPQQAGPEAFARAAIDLAQLIDEKERAILG